jgi:hypothetical protein
MLLEQVVKIAQFGLTFRHLFLNLAPCALALAVQSLSIVRHTTLYTFNALVRQ